MTAAAENPSKPEPMKTGWWDEALAKHKGKRCTAHKHNGEQCRKFAIDGTNVCRVHGGAAPQVKRAARLRLEMAADRMARQLLGMATDPNVADPVKLAAIKDALDRGGIQSKTAVSVEVGVKPFELVFDAIVAGPRDPDELTAIESNSVDESTDTFAFENLDDPDEIEGEYEVVDVEVVDSTGTAYPGDPSSSVTVELSGPLGMSGPAGSGLMPLSEAVAAQADMRARAAARTRDMRRR